MTTNRVQLTLLTEHKEKFIFKDGEIKQEEAGCLKARKEKSFSIQEPSSLQTLGNTVTLLKTLNAVTQLFLSHIAEAEVSPHPRHLDDHITQLSHANTESNNGLVCSQGMLPIADATEVAEPQIAPNQKS